MYHVDMANDIITEFYRFSQFRIERYRNFIFLLVLPFNSLLIKVVTKDLGFTMSRHIIMFSMPVSDLIQSLLVRICNFIFKVLNGGTDTKLCHVLRDIAMKFETVNACNVSLYGHGNNSKA